MNVCKKQILEYARSNQKVNATVLASAFGMKPVTARQYLCALAKSNALVRVGHGVYAIDYNNEEIYIGKVKYKPELKPYSERIQPKITIDKDNVVTLKTNLVNQITEKYRIIYEKRKISLVPYKDIQKEIYYSPHSRYQTLANTSKSDFNNFIRDPYMNDLYEEYRADGFLVNWEKLRAISYARQDIKEAMKEHKKASYFIEHKNNLSPKHILDCIEITEKRLKA